MSEPININKANLTQLKTIKGIGDAKAQAIIRAREQKGPLNSANVFELTYISSTTWSSLLEDNLTFGVELSEEDWSSVVLMLRDKISSLQEERNSLADRFNLEVEKAKEYTKAQQEEQRLEFEKDRDTYMKKAGIDIQDYN